MRLCSVDGCEKRHFGHGYCGMHYQRFQKFGSLDDPNPEDHGQRKKHPLFRKWCQIKRLENGRAVEWDDFWQFVSDVGERPERGALEALDYSKPIGKNNFKWSEMGFGLIKPRTVPSHCQAPGCFGTVRTSGLCNTHYERMRSRGTLEEAQPRGTDKIKATLRKRKQQLIGKYGITPEQYLEIYDSQEGKCKICKTWKERLSIDHCHKLNVFRGLVCNTCNSGLGLFKDSTDNLKSAIVYLEDYAKIKSRS